MMSRAPTPARIRLARVALTCAVASFAGTAGAMHAHAAAPTTDRAHVETAGVQDELESEALRDQLGALAVAIEAAHPGDVVHASVSDVIYGYEIAVTLNFGGVESTDQLRCAPCGVGEAVAKVDDHLRNKLDEMRASASEGGVAAPDGSGDDGSEDSTATSDAVARSARRRFLVGASTVGVGVIGVAVGIGLAVRGDEAVDGGTAGAKRFTTRPIGYTTLGVGLGLAAVGATLMVIYRPRAANDDVAQFRLFPSVVDISAPSAGIQAVGRF